MTNRPRLYPGHQHQWAEQDPDPHGLEPHLSSDFTPPPRAMVYCTVCGFQAPRNAAGLDGPTFTARHHVEGRSLNEQLIDLANQNHEPTDTQPEQEPT